MTTTPHKTLVEAHLHECKGVSTASANTVPVCDGAGAKTYQKIAQAQLATGVSGFETQLLHVREEQAATLAGGTFTSGAQRTRVLNTTKTNEISGSALSSNQITLPAGTYFCMASAPGNACGTHIAQLYNTTDSATILTGTSEGAGSSIPTRSHVNGRFTLSGVKVLELRHICTTTQATNGLGLPTSLAVTETYAEVLIWKVA